MRIFLLLLTAVVCRADVYLSTDVGETWAARGPKDFSVTQLVPDPKSPAVAWAIATPTVAAPGEALRFASPAVLRTGDSGRTWEAIESYKGPDPFCIAVDPANTDVVYVGGTFGRIQKSSDGGKTWALISLKDSFKKLDGTTTEPQVDVHVVSARGDRLLAAGCRALDVGYIALSTDAGKTWTMIRADSRASCVFAGDRILAVNRFGEAVSSTDNGRTWTIFRNMRGMEPQVGDCYGAFATSPDGKEVVFSCHGDTKSSVDSADWKIWPASVKNAYAANVAWSGTRMLAIFRHGEYDDREGAFHEGAKRSLRIHDVTGEWIPISAPDERLPISLASNCDGSAVWFIAK